MSEKLSYSLEKYVPKPKLNDLYEYFFPDIKNGNMKKNELINKLVISSKDNTKLYDKLENLRIQYTCVGRNSYIWSTADNKFRYPKSDIEKKIKQKLGSDPFSSELKAELTEDQPTLNLAHWITSQELRLDFTYIAKTEMIEVGYEIKRIQRTGHANALIRLTEKTIIIETRSNYDIGLEIHKQISKLLGIKTQRIKFNTLEIEKLKKSLKARKRMAKHKRNQGEVDTVRVKAAKVCSDLDGSEEYNENLKKGDLKEASYIFDFVTSTRNTVPVSFGISSKGSVRLFNLVPEEVIDHVLSNVREIKRF